MADNPGPSRPGRPRSDHVPNIVFMPPASDAGKNKDPGLQTQIRSNAIRNAKAGWKIKSWSDQDSQSPEPQKQIRAPKQTSIRSVDSTDNVGSSEELHMSRFRLNKPARRGSSRRRAATPKGPDSSARDRDPSASREPEDSLNIACDAVATNFSSNFDETAEKLWELYGNTSTAQGQSPGIRDLLVDLAPTHGSPWVYMTLHTAVAYAASRPTDAPRSPQQEHKIRGHLGKALAETSRLLDDANGVPDSRICFVMLLFLIIARRMNDENAYLAHLSGLEAILRRRRANSPKRHFDDERKTDARVMLALTLADWQEPRESQPAVEYMSDDPSVAEWALGGYGFMRLADDGYISYTLSRRLQLHQGEGDQQSSRRAQKRRADARNSSAALEEAIYNTLRLQLHVLLFGVSQPQCPDIQGRLDALEAALALFSPDDVALHTDVLLWIALTAGCSCDALTAKNIGLDRLLNGCKVRLGWSFDEAIQYLSLHFKWASNMSESAEYFWNGLSPHTTRHCSCKSSPAMSMVLLPITSSWATLPIDPSFLDPSL